MSSAVKYNCKDFSARMTSLYNLQSTIKCFAMQRCMFSNTCTSSDLNYNSIPVSVSPTPVGFQSLVSWEIMCSNSGSVQTVLFPTLRSAWKMCASCKSITQNQILWVLLIKKSITHCPPTTTQISQWCCFNACTLMQKGLLEILKEKICISKIRRFLAHSFTIYSWLFTDQKIR